MLNHWAGRRQGATLATLLAWARPGFDVVIGDPPHWPHPVRWIGRLDQHQPAAVQRVLPRASGRCALAAGVMWMVVSRTDVGWLLGVLALAARIHPAGMAGGGMDDLHRAGGRCLAQSARDVERPLRAGIWRKAVASCHGLSGATPHSSSRSRLTARWWNSGGKHRRRHYRAALFLLLGSAPLAMAYKAVNTSDSMVGYKHEKYRAIGMVSARLDGDVANFLPARLSWLLLSLAAVVCQGRWRPGAADRLARSLSSTAVLTADSPEATVAGALGIRLGGPNDTSASALKSPRIRRRCPRHCGGRYFPNHSIDVGGVDPGAGAVYRPALLAGRRGLRRT